MPRERDNARLGGLARPGRDIWSLPGWTAAVLLASFAAPAGAQTVGTLLANFDHATASGGNNSPRAIKFTTGANADGDGFTISEVTLKLSGTSNFDSNDTYVTINGDDSGSVGSVLITFTTPASVMTGDNTFSAPADSTLEEDTTYWLVTNALTSNRILLRRAQTDAVDTTSKSDWSVDALQLFSSGSWTTSSWAFVYDLRGYAKSASSTDATLSALVIENSSDDSAITLSPTFDKATTGYTARVANGVDEVTVKPTTSDDGATPAYLDDGDTAITDADTNKDDQQVALDVGVNVIKIKVTAEDGNSTETYTVTVTRESAAPGGDLALVSNTGQTKRTQGFGIGYETDDYSQGFTTGSNAGGYNLTSIGVYVVDEDLDSGDSLTLDIYTVTSGGELDNLVLSLTSPTAYADDAVNYFQAPGGTTLAADTDYAVYFDYLDDNVDEQAEDFVLAVTDSNAEDSGAAVGWSIEDALRTDDVLASNGRAFLISVHGSAKTGNATGKPAITGPPQVGETLTAGIGDIADPDNLPTTVFPAGYSFQWQRVDTDGANPVNVGTDSQTYTLAEEDEGKRILVEVSFTDGGGNEETVFGDSYPAHYPIAAIAPALTECPTDSEWCALMTVGWQLFENLNNLGYDMDEDFPTGSIDDTTIEYGGASNEIEYFLIARAAAEVRVKVADAVPLGTVFDFGGTEFTVTEDSQGTERNSDVVVPGAYEWDQPQDFVWIEGQKVRVSVNFPPRLDTARFDGATLTLTYHEDLDTSSVPATTDFSVTVDGGTPASPSSVAVNGKAVTLTLASALTSTQTVTLSYTVPASNPIQDASGLEAAALTDQVVLHVNVSTDATLSALAVEDSSDDSAITLIPTFDKATTGYTARVANDVDEITVKPTTTDDGATPAYLDDGDTAISDADTNKDDQQVSLDVGVNVIKVKVTAEDGNTTQTYTVTVTRESAAPGGDLALVSNVGQTRLAQTLEIGESFDDYTQGFTTGSNANGYYVTSVGVYVDDEDLDAGEKLTLSIYTATSGGKLDTLIHTLTSPATYVDDAVNLFHAPVGATLAADTDYVVELEFDDDYDAEDFVLALTASNAEDAGAAAGWSIEDAFRDDDTLSSTGNAFLISVHGSVKAGNATGKPAITGPPQVGQTLTAGIGDIADADNLPATTFPAGYSFQWMREDLDGGNRVEVGADSQTYTVDAADEGKRIRVEVSFTDGGGNEETVFSDSYPAHYRIAAIAPALTDCPADSEWCALMTVGRALDPVISLDYLGYYNDEDLPAGSIDDTTIEYSGTSNEIDTGFLINRAGSVVWVNVADAVPLGTVFDFGGTQFTVTEDSQFKSLGVVVPGTYEWPQPSGFVWIEGQKVRVSANFPPALDYAIVNGDSLVLTYHEDLDTNSVPATTDFSVTVDSGTPAAPSSVAVTRKEVQLTLASAVTSAQTVTVSYAVPTSNPIQDESGLEAAALTDEAVTNETPASTNVLVTNLAETRDTSFSVGGADDRMIAQAFTLGSAGATLTDVTIDVHSEPLPVSADIAVAIHEQHGTQTANPADSSLYDLTAPTRKGTGNRIFRAPANATLDADNTYFVVVTGTSAPKPALALTYSDSQTGETGWTIADVSRNRSTTVTSWTDAGSSAALKMRLRGDLTASADATLSDLVLEDSSDDSAITLVPTFDKATTSYGASVANDVDEITIKPTTSDDGVTPEYLDDGDTAITDADGNKLHQQVALDVGQNVIKVKVTAEDGNTTETYTVTVTRAALAAGDAALVSSTGQARLAQALEIGDSFDAYTQGFTTGSNANGYYVTSVGVYVEDEDLDAGETLTLNIYTAKSDGRLDQLIHTLTSPATYVDDAVNYFSAPAGATLAADTDYLVEFLFDDDYDADDFVLALTASNAEDAGAAGGWSIEDAYRDQDTLSSTGNAFLISVHGSVKTGNATGKPAITGTPQVGETLTAGIGNIADADNLPATTFPAGYSFQWAREDLDGGNRVEVGTDSETYTVDAADEGKRIRVEVSYTDGGGGEEAVVSDSYPTDYDAAVIGPALTDCPANSEWCALMTVGREDGQSVGYDFFGYVDSDGDIFGLIDDTSIEYGGASIEFAGGIFISRLADDVDVYLADAVPLGTIFNLGGTEFTVTEDSQVTEFNSGDVIPGSYKWPQPSGFGWVVGQQVRVSVNFPPKLETAIVAGDSLMLTYHEDLDTNSVPATTDFSVTVDSGTPAAPSSVAVNGKEVTLTLASTVTSTQTVTLSYTVPATNPIQDASGIAAAALTDQAVDHDTTNDATLSDLVLQDSSDDLVIALDPVFVSDTESYTVWVPNGVDEITVLPTTTDDGATPAYLDKDDAAISDADSNKDDQQVALAVGDNVIKVKVTAEDGNTTKTYTLTVTRSNATGVPEISGTPEVNRVLTAHVDGIDDPDGLTSVTFSYQWVRVDGVTETEISGATSSTYTLAAADEGTNIRVEVSFTDDASNDEGPLSSEVYPRTGAIAPAPPVARPFGVTLVSNVEQPSRDDDAVTVGGGGIVGLDFDIYSHAQPFTTGGNMDGYTLNWVAIDFADEFGWQFAGRDSARVSIYTSRADGGPDASLHVLGSPASIANGNLNRFTAPANATLEANTTYHVVVEAPSGNWGVALTESASEDASSLSDWNIGDKRWRWRASTGVWDEPGTASFLLVELGGVVKGTTNITATGKPAISGLHRVGETLTASTIGVMDANGESKADDGDTGFAYTYQWVRVDGVTETPISGETSSTYTLTSDDLGTAVKVQVSFKDDLGNAEGPLTSDAFPASGSVEIAACTHSDVVWCATMTVGQSSGLARGYCGSGAGIDKCSFGSLSKTDFTLDSQNYTVESIRLGGDYYLHLTLDRDFPAAMLANLSLEVNFDTFELSEAERGNTDDDVDNNYFWDSSTSESLAPTFTDGATVLLELRRNIISTNATLSALAVEDSADDSVIALTPVFASDTESYTVWVPNGVDEITVLPTTTDDGATPAYLDKDDAAITDADTNKDDQQVALTVGDNVIKVKVTAEDGNTTKTYTLTVTRSNATGVPEISGTPEVNRVLTAHVDAIDDTDGLTSVTFSYQWVRVDGVTETEISGATSSTYTLAAADEGTNIRVEVSFTDDASNDEGPLSSEVYPPTGAIAVSAPTTAPFGVTLVSNLEQSEPFANYKIVGLAPVANPDIYRQAQPFTTGGNTSGYTLSWVAIDFQSAYGSAFSGRDSVRVSIYASRADGAPDAGLYVLGSPVSIANGNVNRFIAPGNATLDANTTYHVVLEAPSGSWAAGTTDSTSEDSNSLSDWSIGDSQWRLGEQSGSWEDRTSKGEFLFLELGGVVKGATNIAATGKPVIVGKHRVGETLTALTDRIMDANGESKADNDDAGFAYTYQWIRVDGVTETPISGETSGTYTLTSDDLGKTVKVQVSFKDDLGNAEGPLTSDAFPADETIRVEECTHADVVWCATMTVGHATHDDHYGAHGYCGPGTGIGLCNFGSLSKTDFTLDSQNYTVESVRLGGGDEMHLTLDRDFPPALLASLSLMVEFDALQLADAVRGNEDNNVNNNYRWATAPSEVVSAFRDTTEVLLELRRNIISTDATLSALAVEDSADDSAIALTPAFVSATTSYTASVAHDVDEITVKPTVSDDGATPEYLDDGDSTISDSDGNKQHQQIALDVGVNVIKVKVTAEDGNTTETYTLTVSRATAGAEAALVSNTGQTKLAQSLSIGDDLDEHTQLFTTGSSANGYYLTSVGVYIDDEDLEANETLSVDLYTANNSGEADSLAYSLTAPAAYVDDAVNQFHAPAGAVLDADTDYLVAIEVDANAAADLVLALTASDSEDAGAAPGWSIENARRSDGTLAAGGDAFLVSVHGSVKTGNATGKPDISGPPQVGMTLTAGEGDIADADGLPATSFPTGYSFQWIRVDAEDGNPVDIGTDSENYTPVAADVGHFIRVEVSFTDGGGNGETLASDATFVVMPAADGSACDAGTVWCATLTVGHQLDEIGLPDSVGFSSSDSFGSVSPSAFTHQAVEYTATALVVNPQGDIGLTTTPDLPADGAGLVLHVQTFGGELDLPLANATFVTATNRWTFSLAAAAEDPTPLSDISLLRMFSRSDSLPADTAEGAEVAVRLSESGLNFSAATYEAIEGGDDATVTVTLRPAPASTVTIPIMTTGQGGATAADWSGVPDNLTFNAGQASASFTVTAEDDAEEDAGESVLLEFGNLPAGVEAGGRATAEVRLVDDDALGERGELRLVGADGRPSANGEGRLEIFFGGDWGTGCSDGDRGPGCEARTDGMFGTVCSDRFDRSFTVYDGQGNALRTVDNFAPTLACRQMGYGEGEVISNRGYRTDRGLDNYPIWLDDVRCEEDGVHSNTGQPQDRLERCYHAGRGVHNCTHDEDVVLRCTGTAPPQQQTVEPLSVTIKGAPSSHDGTAFTFRLQFSAGVTVGAAAMRDDALEVTGGEVTAAEKVNGRADLWEITLAPSGAEAVEIRVPAGRSCSEAGALCDRHGFALTNAALALVDYVAPEDKEAEEPPEPLTMEFQQVPEEHNGSADIEIWLAFSDDLGPNVKKRLESSLEITGASVSGLYMLHKGKPDRWTVYLTPDSRAPVTVRLAAGGDCASVPCTADGRALSESVSVTIQGPVEISVADAEVDEGPGAELEFEVTLSRAATGTVTVRAATSDDSATAGEDYEAVDRTLTFEPGDILRTVSVRVLDDAHDEGTETLKLKLSKASGAKLLDREAVGTIHNSDPMPKAWLARFGRAAADQSMQAVLERVSGPGETHLRLSGLGGFRQYWNYRPIGLWGTDADGETVAAGGPAGRIGWLGAGGQGAAPLAPARFSDGHDIGMRGGFGSGSGFGTEPVLGAGPAGNPPGLDGAPPTAGSRSMHLTFALPDLALLLTGSSFQWSPDGGAGPLSRLTAWGRGSVTRFNGSEKGLAVGGDVLSATVGVDIDFGRMLAGLALSRTGGRGAYSGSGASGDVESTLISLHPYLRAAVTDRLDAWGMLGYGRGGLRLGLAGGADPIDTALASRMGAVGLSGELWSRGPLRLEARSDALWSSTSSAATAGLASATGDAGRLRLVVQGSGQFAFGSHQLTPRLELGARYDAGDAETGRGLELGVGLGYANTELGLTFETRARLLVAHEDRGYREWGASGSLSFSPGEAGRGLRLKLTSQMGAAASGVERLWSMENARGIAPGLPAAPEPQLSAALDYGLETRLWRGLATPFVEMQAGSGQGRQRAGLRFDRDGGAGTQIELSVERVTGLSVAPAETAFDGLPDPGDGAPDEASPPVVLGRGTDYGYQLLLRIPFGAPPAPAPMSEQPEE